MILNQAGTRRFRAYTSKHLDDLLLRAGLDDDQRLKVRAVATVLPFRTNAYVVDELIDWSAAPDDPMYRLVFPQEDMLPAADVARLADLLKAEAPNAEIQAEANRVRAQLNPHPAGQKELNVPRIGDEPVPGLAAQVSGDSAHSSPSRGRPVTPTAPTASAGRSSSATPI